MRDDLSHPQIIIQDPTFPRYPDCRADVPFTPRCLFSLVLRVFVYSLVVSSVDRRRQHPTQYFLFFSSGRPSSDVFGRGLDVMACGSGVSWSRAVIPTEHRIDAKTPVVFFLHIFAYFDIAKLVIGYVTRIHSKRRSPCGVIHRESWLRCSVPHFGCLISAAARCQDPSLALTCHS
jgi:hypothetical protein